MNATQRRIVLILTAVTALVFVAVLIASLAPPDDESPAAGATTTSAGTTTSSETLPSTTTTLAPTTTSTASTTTSSTTTSTSTSTTSTSTTTSTTAPSPLELRGDGLGSVSFGDEADGAIQALTDLLGAPAEDSGWIPSFSGFGTCPGEHVRGMRWATMWVLMTDGSTEWRDDGVPHFFAYLNSVFYDETQSLGLATETGLALGDRIDALRQAYGDDVTISFDDLIDGFIYTIAVPAPGQLSGGLTGDQNEDRITSIDGGTGCGE